MTEQKKRYNIGDMVKNRKGEKAVIIGKDSDKSRNWIIRFVDTGYDMSVECSHLSDGQFKDLLKPSVYGVGFTSKWASKEFPTLYKCWKDMIRRCYSSKHKSYKNYGARGVRVCNEWLHVENFIRDAQLLPNYELFLRDSSYTLDKDILSLDGKLYSPENCMWASPKEQASAGRRAVHVVVFPPEGSAKGYATIIDCSKELNKPVSAIRQVLDGKRDNIDGHRFIQILYPNEIPEEYRPVE